MDDHGLLPRLDIFKAMAQVLAEQNAEKMGYFGRTKLGKTWLQSFPNRTPRFPQSLNLIWTVNVHWHVALDTLQLSTILVS